ATGPTGATGLTGATGPTGATGTTGPSDAWVARSDTSTAPPIATVGYSTLVSLVLTDSGSYTFVAGASLFNGGSDASTICKLVAGSTELSATTVETTSAIPGPSYASVSLVGATTVPVPPETISVQCTTTAGSTVQVHPTTLIATKVGMLHT